MARAGRTDRTRHLVCAVALVWCATPAAAGEAARGVVFEDLDADGVRDAGEPGVPGVRVSDGRRFATTDASGRWSLALDGDAVIFVVKPSDWMTPVDGRMLPVFHYVHQPGGSPAGLRYPGIAPTGPLPESIDFALRRRPEPRRFDAILFADTQPQTSAEVDYLRDDVVAELIGTDAAFGMTLGDIMFDDLSLLPRLLSVISRIGIPWYNVPGNHEINLYAPDDRHALETYKRVFGPPHYAFDYGDAHFVVLDNINYLGGGQANPSDVRGDGTIEGRIGEQQLAWLASDLKGVPGDKLVFLTMHAPLRTYTTDQPRANTADRKDLFELLAGREHLYAVAGHTHTTEHHYFGKEDGFPGPGEFHHHVLTTVSGSWWSGPMDERGIAVAEQRDGTPNGYHVLEVDGADLSVRYKAAGQPDDYQMRIVLDVAHHRYRPEALRDFRPGDLFDTRLSADEVPAADVVVNLFDGGPRSQVSFAVGDFGPIQMHPRRIPDPQTQELFARNADTVKPWVEAIPSSHLWVGDLPDALGPGTYTLTVKAVDEFGRVHHAHKVIEIEGSPANPGGAPRYPER